MNTTLRTTTLIAAVAAAFTLAACDRRDDRTAGQKVDSAVAAAKDAGRDMKESATAAGQTVATGAADAAITAKVNAALAADDKLSAIRIDVDTKEGKVTLNGTAPDPASRDRATTLAAAVSGVMSVDNKLAVKGS